MNITYITNVRIPTSRAAGYAVMKMCEGFSSVGAKVTLYVPNRSDSDKIGDPFGFYKVQNIFKIEKVPGTDFLGKSLSFGKLFYWIDICTFLLSLMLKRKSMKDDVVYTRDFLVPLVFSKNSFICLEVHDIPKNKFIFRFIIKKPKMFFVLNKYIKKSLVELGVDEAKIHVVPSGVDIGAFSSDVDKMDARSNLALPLDKNIVVYTGHFYKWKGVNTLLEVAKKMNDVIFVFVGGVEPEFSKFRMEADGKDNIVVVPYTDRSIVAMYLKASDVLVVPNSKFTKISSEYTSPLKLLEYMASGRPVVASDLPSLREVLDETNSVFATPDDPVSFELAIRKVLSDKILAESISNKAKIDVLPYDWSNRSKKIQDLIKANLYIKNDK